MMFVSETILPGFHICQAVFWLSHRMPFPQAEASLAPSRGVTDVLSSSPGALSLRVHGRENIIGQPFPRQVRRIGIMIAK